MFTKIIISICILPAILEPSLFLCLNVPACLHVMSAAPVSTRYIESARHEPSIPSNITSLTTLYCSTLLTSMFTTIFTDITFNEAIHSLIPLHRVRFSYGNWLGSLYWGIGAYWFNMVRFLNWRRIVPHRSQKRCYVFVRLCFSEPGLSWLLPGRDIPYGIVDCPGIILRVWISSTTVVGGGVAATMSVCSSTIARTINSAVSYIISLMDIVRCIPHPCWVDLSNLQYLCQMLSMHCCPIWHIVPPSRVCHLRSAFPALCFLHYLLNLPHPPPHQNL